ncbi:ATS1 protein [Bisporella sp. PMI_857]|nr:ATS1 protein [Bisporella sp. PMI_857]
MSTVYALGSNGSGQLGIGHKEDVSVPKPVLFKATNVDPITQVKAGGNHSLLLSSKTLFYAGDTHTGACGVLSDSQDTESHFQEIFLALDTSVRPEVALFAATWEASIIVLQDNNKKATKVYTFGTGSRGELGLGPFLFRSSKAQLIENFPPQGLEVVDLGASVSHVVAVLSNGDVYGWGNGRKGQLGQPEGILHSPRKISGVNFEVTRAVCGREFTYLIGDAEQGQHLVLGSDKWNVRSEAPVDVRGWKDVGATWGSIFVLRNDGKLLSWGRDDHGQLAPPGLPFLTKISIGSEHALGLTEARDVLAWGWGEHGNCGPNTTNGDVQKTWNVVASSKYLPPGCQISSIGAGCATTWICISS